MTMIGRSSPQLFVDPRVSVPVQTLDDTRAPVATFSDLLAGLVKPCNGSSGFLEDEQGSPSPEPVKLQQASVFNGDGLFYGVSVGQQLVASDTARQDFGQPPTSSVTPVASLPERLDISASKVAVGMPLSGDTAATPIASANLSERQSVATSQPEARPEARREANPTPPGATRIADVLPTMPSLVSSALPTAARSTRAGRLSPAFEASAAKTSIDVMLLATGDGHAVVAQPGTVSRAERLKLRDRIAALLSRHGLIVRSVRIGGRPDVPATVEKGR